MISATGFRHLAPMENSSKLAYIDWMRGLAILLVIATHVKGIVPDCSGLTNAVLSFGRMGVQLFFVVSACTLYQSWLRSGSSPGALKRFYLRRYLRIAPMYLFGILIYLTSAIVKHYASTGVIRWPEQFSAPSILTNLFLVHAFYPPGNNNVVPGGWSIGTEILFYVIFPGLIWLVGTEGPRKAVLLTASSIVILVGAHTLAGACGYRMTLGDFWYHSLPNQLPVFLIGIATAARMSGAPLRVHPVAVLGSSSVLLLISFLIWNAEHTVWLSLLPAVTAGAFACLVAAAGMLPGDRPVSLLSWLQVVGRHSFSMYVWHFVIIDVVQHATSGFLERGGEARLVVFYALVCIVTLVISRASVRMIEEPGIRLARRLCARIG